MLLLYDTLLICLGIEDFKKRKIRNQYVAGILLLAMGAVVVMPEISVVSRVIAMFAVSVPMMVLNILKPGSFGGGDVKLVFACGAFLGWKLVVKGTVIAIFLAGAYCIWLICIKREGKNVQFALGPFLSAGFFLSTFSLF